MRVYVLPIICMLLVLTGCGTLKSNGGFRENGLSRKEKNFSQALAHFAQGLIYEQELCRNSSEALEQFVKAV